MFLCRSKSKLIPVLVRTMDRASLIMRLVRASFHRTHKEPEGTAASVASDYLQTSKYTRTHRTEEEVLFQETLLPVLQVRILVRFVPDGPARNFKKVLCAFKHQPGYPFNIYDRRETCEVHVPIRAKQVSLTHRTNVFLTRKIVVHILGLAWTCASRSEVEEAGATLGIVLESCWKSVIKLGEA